VLSRCHALWNAKKGIRKVWKGTGWPKRFQEENHDICKNQNPSKDNPLQQSSVFFFLWWWGRLSGKIQGSTNHKWRQFTSWCHWIDRKWQAPCQTLTATSVTDAHAIDMKYHKNGWTNVTYNIEGELLIADWLTQRAFFLILAKRQNHSHLIGWALVRASYIL